MIRCPAGLGDIGPRAALPVLEVKAALYKRFAGIDAWPLCLDVREVPEMVRCISAVAPGSGGMSLEDVSAPRCFERERQLREVLDIPVFHDDQYGTAVGPQSPGQCAARDREIPARRPVRDLRRGVDCGVRA